MTSAASSAASSLSVTMLPWVRRSFPVTSSLVFHSSNYPLPSPVVRVGGRIRHLSKKTKSHPNNTNNNTNNSNANKEEVSSQTPESPPAATTALNHNTTPTNHKKPPSESNSTLLFTTTSVPPPIVSTKSNSSSTQPPSSSNNNSSSSRNDNAERPKPLRREKTTVVSGLYKQQPQPPHPPPLQPPPKNTTTMSNNSRTPTNTTTSLGTSPPVTLLFQQRQVYPPPAAGAAAARRSELPILHASALLDPKMHCQMDSITGVTSRSGTDAARRLAEGRKTLLETMRFEWLRQQRPGSSSSNAQNASPPPPSYASRRRSSRPHVLTGHGAPKSLLQHHIDYTDLFLQQLNGVACSFRNFEDRGSHNSRTTSSSSSRSQQPHPCPHPQPTLQQQTSWVIHHERQFDSMQVVGVDGQSRHCSWPLPLSGEEGTKGMGLYLAVMNRIAEHLSVVFPKATTTTSTPLTTTPDESYDIGTRPEFSSASTEAAAAAANDTISDEDDDDFVVANTSSFRDRTRASWWKVEMSRGSKYASHVLPESYRLEGDPVLVVTCEPQFRVVSLQLQGIPTTQRNHPSGGHGHQQQHHFYNHHQHNFGVSEPLTLEFHARFPLSTQPAPSSTPL